MNVLRRILGIAVMVAGFLGLVLSIAGLLGVWMAKPAVVEQLSTTVTTLNNSIDTSQEAMTVTQDALEATVNSLDALSVMLEATAASVDQTAPVIAEVNVMLGENLPGILEAAGASLRSAQQAAVVMDSTVRSLESFQLALSDAPLIGDFVQVPEQTYAPDEPLADSLGAVADNLEGLPSMFTQMAADMNSADDNLGTIQESLTVMAENVDLISGSLADYEAMVAESQTSLGDLKPVLADLEENLGPISNGVALVLTLFLLWLLAIQVVVLSQGWELYQGTAGRMEGDETEEPAAEATV
jgi:methyl-accepting chemotaxis protein